MSTIKNIMAVINDAASGRATLRTAVRVARQFDCHIDALHVRPDPVAALPLVGEAMSGNMVNEMMVVAERESGLRAKAVRAMYAEEISVAGLESQANAGFAATWHDAVGAEEQIVAVRACRADVILLARPTRENETAALMTLNAALMQSGRPVLAVPPAGDPLSGAFSRIALFWNGSTEATRAVTSALPFLAAAERVTVLRVEEEEWFAPTDDLEAFLAFHGIKPAISKVLPRGPTGEALLAAAGANGDDMMVMGAYTRSKLRQLILGSVTGYVMEHAALPVLLCH